MIVASVDNVTVRFQPHRQTLLLRQRIRNLFARDQTGDFLALNGISFQAHAGEGIAVLGQNGAGKSTLLSVMAGVLKPDTGSVQVAGRVGALLELGAGFHPDLSGRENLVLYAALMGLSRTEVAARFDEILEFSELGGFIDEPLKNYSAGMRLRLAFSVAAHVECPVVMIDEVLAVGDAAFAHKCIEHVKKLRASGALLVYVTHSIDGLDEICSRAIWLHRGALVQDGPINEVAAAYKAFMADPHRRFRDPAES
jgi:ABC-type polysaccharide/polyol phosphate transport system ATPase subunit